MMNFYSHWFRVHVGLFLFGGDTPLYKLYRYVQCQKIWSLIRFGLKKVIDFNHFGLMKSENGYGF